MADFFNKVVDDAKSLEKELLGPDYPYYAYIATPDQLGMGTSGSLSQTATNVAGMINYIQMMVEGTGKANRNPLGQSQPMGDRFFLKTGGQCMDNQTKQLVDRYIYVNNVPNGSIPFLTPMTGIQFGDFTGLIPGIMEDLGALNPLAIMKGFMEGNNPPCTEISMTTIGQPPGAPTSWSGVKSFHVADSDIKDIAPCDFCKVGQGDKVSSGCGKNPLTGVGCRATFTTLDQLEKQGHDTSFRKQRPLVQSAYPSKESYNNFYILIFGLLLLFIVQKLLKKN